MADNRNDQSEALRDSGTGGGGQADVDALLSDPGLSSGGDAPPSGDMPQGEAARISPADLNALIGGAGGDTGTPEGDVADVGAAGQPLPDAPGDTSDPPFDQAAPARDAGAQNANPVEVRPYAPQELGATAGAPINPKRVTMLNDVNLRVKIQLGGTRMLVEDVLKLGEGSVVELDKLAGDPVDVLVNDRLIAHGEVLVLNDNFCVRISEVLSHDPHRVTE